MPTLSKYAGDVQSGQAEPNSITSYKPHSPITPSRMKHGSSSVAASVRGQLHHDNKGGTGSHSNSAGNSNQKVQPHALVQKPLMKSRFKRYSQPQRRLLHAVVEEEAILSESHEVCA